jgi:hypothetical protein
VITFMYIMYTVGKLPGMLIYSAKCETAVLAYVRYSWTHVERKA